MMETLLHFGMVVWGWLGYNVYQIARNQKRIDLNRDGWISWDELNLYYRKQFWQLLFTAMFIVVGTFTADDVWYYGMQLAGKDWKFTSAVYWIMGAGVPILQYLIRRK